MFKFLKYGAIGFGSLAIVVVVLTLLYFLMPDQVVLHNSSNSTIIGGTVIVCRQQFTIGEILPGREQTITFKINTDSDYDLSVTFASGKTIQQSVGYVTPGLPVRETLNISEKNIQIK